MGMLRTINHPGIEIQEVDMSGSAEQVGGCTTLVMGFFPQGESGKPVNPTSLASVKSYFGTPENEAERYAYYACKTVFDNGGRLVASRIPYNNNSQYITPAVKYKIEEWSTKHIKKYSGDSNANMVVNNRTASYSGTELGNDTNPDKNEFFYYDENITGIGVYSQSYHDRIEWNSSDNDYREYDGNTLAISSTRYAPTSSTINDFYEVSFNEFSVTTSFEFNNEERTITAVVCSYQDSGVTVDGDVSDYSELRGLSDEEISLGSIYRVEEGFENPGEGYYLSSVDGFANDSCFQKLIVTDDEYKYVNSVNELSSGSFMSNYAAGLSYDMLIYVGEVDENGDFSNPPLDTVLYELSSQGDSYLPTSGTVVETDDGFKSVFVSYRSATNESRYEEISNDTIIKVVNDYMLNYSASVPDISDSEVGSTVTITWTSLGKTDGWYVYSREGGYWRPFYDYYDDPGAQWSYIVVNKYSGFSVYTTDTLPQGDGGFGMDTGTSKEAAGLDTPMMTVIGTTSNVTSRLYGSLAEGNLRFITVNGNSETILELNLMPIFNPAINDGYNPNTMALHPELFDPSFFTEANSRYFNITEKKFDKWISNTQTTTNYGFYTETLCADNKNNFCYDSSISQPTTAYVDTYTETGTKKVVAIKSYYEPGVGVQYPEMDANEYIELRIWDDKNQGMPLSSLNEDNFDKFDIIKREYVGTLVGNEICKINEKSFKSAPISTDVTNGYVDNESSPFVTSDKLAIPATDIYDKNNYPFVSNMNPFGTGYIKVLTELQGVPVTYDPDDFYQFVSPYLTVEQVALAHSEKYKWIHWYTPKNDDEDVSSDKRILLSHTLGCEIEDVPLQLSDVESLVTIIPDVNKNGYIPLEEYQDYRDSARTPDDNTIVIANITEQKFVSDTYNNSVVSEGESTSTDYADEVLGIMPVLIGGFQALPRQSRIEIPDGITNAHLFNAVESVVRGSSIENDPAPAADHVDVKAITLNEDGFVRTLGTTSDYDPYDSTYSNQLISSVPAIDLNSSYKPNGAKMNYVTLAVCRLSLSKVNDNRVAVTVLETFTGSLDRTAKDENGNSAFIDNIVNNEDTGSAYVRMFSNYKTKLTGSQTVTQSIREIVPQASNDTKVTLTAPTSLGQKLWWTNLKPSMSLGFTEEQTKKYISYATIVASIENTFDALSNVDELDLDLVVDAGISSIANRIKRITDMNPEKTKDLYDVFYENITDVDKVAGWKSICSKLTTFCQTTRKDCIALLDAPRNLCVKDGVKLVQPGGKYSVDYDILPKFNYIGGMNSSYAAGYCDWLLAVDDFTSKSVWLPPSIAAEGSVIYTDYNSNYWMPPAGQNRGNVMWAVDVAFNPNAAQQDSIYSKGWNYAVSSSGSIMVWGQKTMLNSTSSFNRINIRRLFCRLERMTRKNSKWVIFEINNERTRNIYKDRIDPIFANVKAMGGIYDYQIICDTRNNTPSVIQDNSFRAAFLIKPEHAAEYIILTFFNMNQDMDFSEAYSQL